MDDKIFLSTLLYKHIVEKSTKESRDLSYVVLGPMMGTLDGDIFINNHDRKYYSIEKINTNMDDNIRYAYYNIISLKEAKKKYKTDNIEEIVIKYKEEYIKDSYFVLDALDVEPIIIKYDKDKFKRIYESDIAKPVY